MDRDLTKRSGGACELCTSTDNLTTYVVTPKDGSDSANCVLTCAMCNDQLSGKKDLDPNHWRCLNDSMWSEVDAVKVVAWRTLTDLKSEGWPNDLLEMIYMEEDLENWAKEGQPSEDAVIHIDSNGVQLSSGDSVVLIKDLKVKGGNFTAKRGTAVRNITLVHDNPEHIEGKVEGQRIVILTQYVKK